MSARSVITTVIAVVLGLAWLSAAISGSAEWGIGVFAVAAVLFFIVNPTRPALRD